MDVDAEQLAVPLGAGPLEAPGLGVGVVRRFRKYGVREMLFGEPLEFGPLRLTAIPAGHCFGSAMLLAESGDSSLLYTGDFKLRTGLSAEPCEPRPADILIMETTYGRPHYQFPPTEGVIQGVIRFCREALDNEETPVLLGYSLGKSQELLTGLAAAELPVMRYAVAAAVGAITVRGVPSSRTRCSTAKAPNMTDSPAASAHVDVADGRTWWRSGGGADHEHAGGVAGGATGVVTVRLRYGTGRPERRYRSAR